MAAGEFQAVTGAFGYTGRYITRRLLAMGMAVKTLTNHPGAPEALGGSVAVAPLRFDDPGGLARSLEDAKVLYNTYWVRFSHGAVTFDAAVANTKKLIQACREAGVGKIVHISITNAAADSSLPYFRGKGVLEGAIRDSGLPHAILRPTVIFGQEDILINNIAWFVRHFPVFAVPGDGTYRLQPVFVEDVAELAVRAAGERENVVLDAVGPEVYTFDELVGLIAATTRRRTKRIHLPPPVALALTGWAGRLVRDVVLTREELEGLMQNLLLSESPPTGRTKLSEWLAENAGRVGATYASELSRHYR